MRLAGAALLLTAVAAITACGGTPPTRTDSFGLPLNHPIVRAELATHPEAELSYPGSQLAKVVGSDQIAKPNGQEPDPAYSGAIYTATATPAQLYAWYATWLTSRGYHPVTFYRLTDQPSGVAWQVHEGREQVQISVFDPQLLARDQNVTPTVPAGGLIYEEVLVAYPPPVDNEH
jgi:hypothetical protein